MIVVGTGGSCGDPQVNAWWSWPASWIVARNVASLQRRILNYPCVWPYGCRWGYLDWWNPSNMEELGMVNVGGDDDFLGRELRLSSFWILNEMIIDVGQLVVVGRWVVTGHMYCDGGMCDLSRRCGLCSNLLAILMHLESNHHLEWNLSSVCSISTITPVLSKTGWQVLTISYIYIPLASFISEGHHHTVCNKQTFWAATVSKNSCWTAKSEAMTFLWMPCQKQRRV